MNPFDLMKSLPEVTKIIPQVEEFIKAWLAFMNKLSPKLDYLEAKAETNENLLNFLVSAVTGVDEKLTLLIAESNISPNLQQEVEAMSAIDPRNNGEPDIIPAWAIVAAIPDPKTWSFDQ